MSKVVPKSMKNKEYSKLLDAASSMGMICIGL
jgi:hypothetical protein